MSETWRYFVYAITGKFPRSVDERIYAATIADRLNMQEQFEKQQELSAHELALIEAKAHELTAQLAESITRWDAATARADDQANAVNEAVARLTTLVDRSQTAIERQMDAATAHFRSKTAEVEGRLSASEAASREVQAAALDFKGIVSEMRSLLDQTQANLPAFAENAIREIIGRVEQEEGVLALALANVSSFTSNVSKTLERDQ